MSDFHCKKISACLRELKTSVSGLTLEEAEARLKKDGYNELQSKKFISKFKIFLSQFNNPLIYVLIIAGFFSLLMKDFHEAVIIAGAVALNSFIGFFQEYKANQAIQKLKRLVEQKAVVVRGGKEMEILSKLLAVGDIIIVKSGDRAPADARLIKTFNLQVDEAALTGESFPVSKSAEPVDTGTPLADRKNIIYAGTIMIRGRGVAVVTAVGKKTEMGKIAQLVSETVEEKTPLQRRLHEFGKQIGIAVFAVCLVIFFIGILQNRGIFEMFLIGVSIAVASIPEGLTIAVTVALALGMRWILKKKALTRKLVAAETLGSTTVICSDKTGTLTEGKMHVAHIISGDKAFSSQEKSNGQKKFNGADKILKAAALCNEAMIENPDDELADWKIIGAPTETALLSAAVQAGFDKKRLLTAEPQIGELPFDSEKKYMITLHKRKGGFILYEKGAPEKILKKSSEHYCQGRICRLSEQGRQDLISVYERLTAKGLRIIAVAAKEIKHIPDEENIVWPAIDNNLLFLGFIALKDPVREEAKETIRICRQAGIRPVIITGDHHLTAKAVALEIGLKVKAENILTGEQLDKISDEKLKHLAKKIEIYARVSPHHKLRIIKTLQSRGEVVAMTGDGINDAPALKAADIGIALGTGADIAKETSDIVLLDNNFKTIVAAVRQGRVIFSNIRKVITYLISDSFSEIILIAGSIIMGMPLAVLPAQILWINIINDGLPSFALAYEEEDEGIMDSKPIRNQEPILTQEMKLIIFLAGAARDLFILGIFIFLLKRNYDIMFIRTVIFAALGFKSIVYIFSLRSFSRPIWKMNPFSNNFLLIAAAASLFLLVAGIYWRPLQSVLTTVPIVDYKIWALIISAGALSIVMIEAIKGIFIQKNSR